MTYYLVGAICVDGVSHESLVDLLSETTGYDSDHCSIRQVKSKPDCYEVDFSDQVTNGGFDVIFPEAAKRGYTVNGELSYYGDGEGRYVAEDNQVTWLDIGKCYLRDALDDDLIRELERRGYTVSRN